MRREAWPDERLDDLSVDIRELREKQRELRAELNALRREMIDEIRAGRR
jgi:chaperonin cofactor prefoldin